MKYKNSITISLLFVTWLIVGSKGYAQIQTFEWQGVQRQYLVRTPTQQQNDIPVMFFLHGLGDNITHLDNEFHFSQISDQLGWAIVVPQALNEGMGTMWNAGLMSSSIDDSGFLMALLDALAEPYQLNLDSVFFTGFSMGGFMTHRMAIEHGDRIAACAPVSGLITFSMSNLTPVAPVRILHIHGTSDPVVGYDGNSQYFGGTLGLGVDAILNYWKNANGCDNDDPKIDSLPDLHNDGLRFIRYTYDCGTELQHLKVIGGNHNWYNNANQYDVSYLDEIYHFFKGNVGSDGIQEPHDGDLRIWPNPTKGMIEVEVSEPSLLIMMNLQGQMLMQKQVVAGRSQIDLNHLVPGLYLVKTQDGKVTKLVID